MIVSPGGFLFYILDNFWYDQYHNLYVSEDKRMKKKILKAMSFALAVSMVTPMVCMPGMSVYAEEESVDIVADDEEGEVSSEEESTEEQQPTVNLVYDDFVEILLGATKDLTVNATSTVSGSTLTYQWYKDIKDQETPELIDGATSNVLTITGEANVVGYSCEVSDGTTDNVASFTISLNSGLVVNETSDSVDVSLNETATMEVTAASSTGRTITYQWKKYDAITDSYTDIAGATSNKYEVQGAKGMVNKYLCVVSDGISEIEVEYEVVLDSGISVDAPESIIVEYGKSLDIKVSAESALDKSLSYRWLYFDSTTEEYLPIQGATKSVLTVTGTKGMATDYKCEVTDGITVVSVDISVELDTGLELTYEPEVNIEYGKTAALKVGAKSGRNYPIKYRWYTQKEVFNEETQDYIVQEVDIDNTTDTLNVMGSLDTASVYVCVVSDGIYEKECIFDVTVDSKLTVDEYNSTVKVPYGGSLDVTAKATSPVGLPLTYQWFTGWEDDAGNCEYFEISAAKDAKITIDGVKGIAYRYKCEISDGITTVEAEYTVILDTGLDVTYNPEVDLKYGDNAELKVNATCTEGQNITYQWYAYKINAETEEVTASAIEGANTDTLSIKADENSAPKYMCKVTDGISVIRSVFDINIDTGLTLSAKKSVVSAEYSTTARLEVSASTKIASGVKYQWYEYVYDETEKKYFYDECEGQDATLLLTLDGSTAGKYKCIATDGVNSKSVEIELNVLQRDIAKASVELDETLYTFNGVAKKPELFIEDGEYFLEEYKDYVISYENNIYPGTAKVVITGRGGYVGSITKTFKINAVKISSLKMTKQTNKSITFTFKKSSVSVDGYIILRADKKNGTYKKIAVTKSTSYTDKKSLKGRTNFYYKVCGYKLVSGKQVVCASSSIVNMTRKPDATRLTVKAGKGKATVKMSKVVGATGYELYMSTSKNGKYKKIATVTKAKSVTKKGLKKGKKYYFKAKVITKSDSKKKFISAYSAAKSVKIK